MAETGLPENVRALILQHIESIAQLEVLLLLHGHPGRRMTADEVAKELRIGPGPASTELGRLSRDGFLVEEPIGTWRYEPADFSMARAVDDLARTYPTFRVAIVSLVFSRPGGALQGFSDAFRIRKD